MKNRLFIILSFLLFNSLNAQKIEFKLEEQFLLGADENASEEYLFAYPTFLRTDSKKNIYIADANMSKIRVFSNNGKYIKSIGKKGQGPGEMEQVGCMTIDHEDNLIIVDRINRRFTRFSDFGMKFETFNMPETACYDPRQIISIMNDYLLYYVDKSLINKRFAQPDGKYSLNP